MIPLKAFVAVSLTGLGAAAMGADAYLASHTSTLSRPSPVAINLAPVLVKAEVPTPSVPDPILMLEPVTIYARASAPRAVARQAPPPRELVPCSDWRSLESGPAGHRVQQLCFADAPRRGTR